MTLYELLKQGCTVEFPCGYILKGDPEDGYIECKIKLAGEIHNDGLRSLDKKGTAEALGDVKEHEKRMKELD